MHRNFRTLIAAAACGALALSGCKKDEKKDEGAQGSEAAQGSGSAQQKQAAKPAGSAQDSAKPPEGCNSDLQQEIATDHTFTKACSPYTFADGKVLAVEGWYLTIEPGVELRFGERARIEVGYSKKGRITAKGTAEAPIRFTSAKRQEPGYWSGVRVYENGAGSTIEHAVFEYAGNDQEAALKLRGADVRVKNTKIAAQQGLAVEANEGLVEFSGNDLSEAGQGRNGALIETTTLGLGGIKGDNKFPEKTRIEFSGDLKKSITVVNPGVPLRLTGGAISVEGEEGGSATLTIEAGTVIQMAADSRFEIGYSYAGGMVVKGTQEKPVVFTSAEESPQKGSWQGIKFHPHARNPSIDWARIEWAGGGDEPALKYRSEKTLGKLTNTYFGHIAGAAIEALTPTARFEAFEGNTFEDLDGAVLHAHPANAHGLSAKNTFPQDGYVRLEGNDLRKDTTFTALPIPYRFETSTTIEGEEANKPATLTIEPGAVVQLSPGAELSVGYSYPGRINAKGAADKQIVFAAATDPWNGIALHRNAKLELEHAVLENVAEGQAGIRVTNDAQGSIKNVTFKKMEVGTRNCGKLKVEGLKGEEVTTLEKKDDC